MRVEKGVVGVGPTFAHNFELARKTSSRSLRQRHLLQIPESLPVQPDNTLLRHMEQHHGDAVPQESGLYRQDGPGEADGKEPSLVAGSMSSTGRQLDHL